MRYTPPDNPNEYVARVIRDRLQELGITQTQFLNSNAFRSINKPTFNKVIRGEGSTQYRTVNAYLNALGLEIQIVPVQGAKEVLHELGLEDKKQTITYRNKE